MCPGVDCVCVSFCVLVCVSVRGIRKSGCVRGIYKSVCVSYLNVGSVSAPTLSL